jgi:hypothetical protein
VFDDMIAALIIDAQLKMQAMMSNLIVGSLVR